MIVAPQDVAICVIHGRHGPYCEKDALRHSWPRLQIEQLRRHTPPGYRVFTFGYSYGSRFLPEDELFLRGCKEVEFIPAQAVAHGQYQFTWPLMNWLTRRAIQTHRVIVHLDFDTIPVANDWLEACTGRLSEQEPVVGVALAELGLSRIGSVFSAFHADAVMRHGLDFSPVGVEGVGARMSVALEEAGLHWRKLLRRNGTPYGPSETGLYDGSIYHHGVHPYHPGGQVPKPADAETPEAEQARKTRDILTRRLFENPDSFINALRQDTPPVDLEHALAEWEPMRYPPIFNRFWRVGMRVLRRARLLCRGWS